MKKGIMTLVILGCLVLGGIFLYLKIDADTTPPEIHVDNENLEYQAGMDEEQLLEGVTAEDNRDGNVSSSLEVESIYISEEKETATVVYVAKDSSNNVAKLRHAVKCKEGSLQESDENTEPEETQEETSQGENTTDETVVDETVQGDSTEKQETEASSDQKAQEAKKLQEEKIQSLDAGAPRIYLKEYYVEMKVGDTFEQLSYVSDIQDDKDQSGDLYKRIQIQGEVNTAAEGTYTLTYYVTDSENHMSNQAELTVVVGKGETDGSGNV